MKNIIKITKAVAVTVTALYFVNLIGNKLNVPLLVRLSITTLIILKTLKK